MEYDKEVGGLCMHGVCDVGSVVLLIGVCWRYVFTLFRDGHYWR
jgi:hypothetical protein